MMVGRRRGGREEERREREGSSRGRRKRRDRLEGRGATDSLSLSKCKRSSRRGEEDAERRRRKAREVLGSWRGEKLEAMMEKEENHRIQGKRDAFR